MNKAGEASTRTRELALSHWWSMTEQTKVVHWKTINHLLHYFTFLSFVK